VAITADIAGCNVTLDFADGRQLVARVARKAGHTNRNWISMIELAHTHCPNRSQMARATIIRSLEMRAELANRWCMIAIMAGHTWCNSGHGIIMRELNRGDPCGETSMAVFASIGRW